MTHNKIIQKAAELFLLNGFKTVTMDDIATELAISKKTLYEEFGRKENLIEAVLYLQFEMIADVIADVKSQDQNAVHELIEIKNRITVRFNSPEQKNTLNQLQKYYQNLHQKVYMEQISMVHEMLVSNILKGQQEGLYRKKIEAEYMAQIILLAQNSIKNNKKFLLDLDTLETILEMTYDVIFRGILTPEGLDIYLKTLNQNK